MELILLHVDLSLKTSGDLEVVFNCTLICAEVGTVL